MKVTLPAKDYAAIPAADRYRHPSRPTGEVGPDRVKGQGRGAPTAGEHVHARGPGGYQPAQQAQRVDPEGIDKTRFTAGPGVDFAVHNLVVAGGFTRGRWTWWARRMTRGTSRRGTGAIAR